MKCELDTKDGGVCLGRIVNGNCVNAENHFYHCPVCGEEFGNDENASLRHALSLDRENWRKFDFVLV